MYEETQGAGDELEHGPGDKFHPSPFPAVSQTVGRGSISLGCVYTLSACTGKPFILFSVSSPSNLSSISTIEQMFNTQGQAKN